MSGVLLSWTYPSWHISFSCCTLWVWKHTIDYGLVYIMHRILLNPYFPTAQLQQKIDLGKSLDVGHLKHILLSSQVISFWGQSKTFILEAASIIGCVISVTIKIVLFWGLFRLYHHFGQGLRERSKSYCVFSNKRKLITENIFLFTEIQDDKKKKKESANTCTHWPLY